MISVSDELDADVWCQLTGRHRYYYYGKMFKLVWGLGLGRLWPRPIVRSELFDLDNELDGWR